MDFSEMKQLRCPQNWNFEGFYELEARLKDKHINDDEYPSESTKYGAQVRWYREEVLFSYESYRKGEFKEALEYLNNCNIYDSFMEKYSKVFKHVTSASKAHILYKLNEIDSAKEIVSELQKEKYSKLEEAAFNFIEGSLLLSYGNQGITKCLELLRLALNADNNEAMYHFFVGTVLSKKRHFNFPWDKPSVEEKNALQQAVSLRKDVPEFSIFLARFYVESKNSAPYPQKAEYALLAERQYRKLLEHYKSLSGNDIARCIFNLTKLKSYDDLDVYADEAIEKCNSTLMNHYVGIYYLHLKEYEKCLKMFKRAAEELPFLAGMVLLMVYRTNDNSIDDHEIEEYINQWNDIYKNSTGSTLLDLNMSLSQFFLIVQNDVIKAAKYFIDASQYNIKQKQLVQLCRKTSNNYLCTLRVELMNAPKDDVISKALTILNKLPSKIMTEFQNISTETAHQLKSCLF